ncbi:Rap1a/Tai family immunity protein [Roseomonas sp. HF4]|uniref:Rap1a/Tai family immunity protein n=1 Tax=Roseomonas sp. HF4 TaxID=2562313 RepID=UPI0010BFA504|nr:Rap1a/Tai family immunity protein [Roseomonas sp. HF4]
MAQSRSESTRPAIVTHVQTASELAAICDPAWGGVPRLEAIAYCQGFLTSFGQYHALLYPQGGPARPLFCVPVPGPTVAESGVAFAAWTRDNPRYGNEPALDGLLRWAQANFPCPTRSPARSSRSTR